MQYRFQAIGTHWQITLPDSFSHERIIRLQSLIAARIEAFDVVYSRFRLDSLVSKIAQEAGMYAFPEDADMLFAYYRRCYAVTDGAFTPLIGQVLVDAGYDRAYSLTPKVLRVPPVWDEVMTWRAPYLEVMRPVQLDFGAAGKGYLIDLLSDLLVHEGIVEYTIDAGGDILHRSACGAVLRVGLEHPGSPEQVIGVATIGNTSICGSAGNRRAWGDFHHTINPHTLTSPRDVVAIWVIADKTIESDALATCLSFVAPEVLMPHFDFQYLMMRDDSTVVGSEGFPAELFIA